MEMFHSLLIVRLNDEMVGQFQTDGNLPSVIRLASLSSLSVILSLLYESVSTTEVSRCTDCEVDWSGNFTAGLCYIQIMYSLTPPAADPDAVK